MSKRLKTKKDKVVKLTEEEYVKYISNLKSVDDTRLQTEQADMQAQATQKPLQN